MQHLGKTAVAMALGIASVTAHATSAAPVAGLLKKDVPQCATTAAVEFAVPEKVFHALVISSYEDRQGTKDHHGPMGLYEKVIPIAAAGLGVEPDAVRHHPCENYRAAAWWLMNKAGGREREIWDAVAIYFYGHASRASYPVRDRVRRIYDSL